VKTFVPKAEFTPEELDTSDIPEITDEMWARAVRWRGGKPRARDEP